MKQAERVSTNGETNKKEKVGENKKTTKKTAKKSSWGRRKIGDTYDLATRQPSVAMATIARSREVVCSVRITPSESSLPPHFFSLLSPSYLSRREVKLQGAYLADGTRCCKWLEGGFSQAATRKGDARVSEPFVRERKKKS